MNVIGARRRALMHEVAFSLQRRKDSGASILFDGFASDVVHRIVAYH